jgi:hypothetical protein
MQSVEPFKHLIEDFIMTLKYGNTDNSVQFSKSGFAEPEIGFHQNLPELISQIARFGKLIQGPI